MLTAIDQSIADQKPLLMQFWKPHWKSATVDLVEVALPPITPECEASLAAADGKYACDYPIDELYKAANAGLQAKNAAVFKMLSAMQLTTDQQSEIGSFIDGDGMPPEAAAKKWVDANPDVWKAWLA